MLACAPIGDWYFGYFGLYTVYPHVVGSNMLEYMFNKIGVHEDMLFHKGEYVTHMKIQGIHVVLALLAI